MRPDDDNKLDFFREEEEEEAEEKGGFLQVPFSIFQSVNTPALQAMISDSTSDTGSSEASLVLDSTACRAKRRVYRRARRAGEAMVNSQARRWPLGHPAHETAEGGSRSLRFLAVSLPFGHVCEQ